MSLRKKDFETRMCSRQAIDDQHIQLMVEFVEGIGPDGWSAFYEVAKDAIDNADIDPKVHWAFRNFFLLGARQVMTIVAKNAYEREEDQN
jgi:hypothetical protein